MFLATGSLILPTTYEAALPQGSSTEEGVLSLSRGTSMILLTIYLLYLFFQLNTHRHIFEPDSVVDSVEDNVENTVEDDVEDESGESISFGASLFAGLLVAIAISICSDNLVGSIDEVVKSSGVSKTFYALILIPIIGNAGI